jgi:hypothetical protein
MRVVADEPAAPDGEPYRAAVGPRVVVERSGLLPGRWFAFFWCVFWDGCLVLWYARAFQSASFIELLFPVIHLAVGVFVTYWTICGFLNRTTISLERGTLSVRHGPLPWPGNLRIESASLDQLFCKEQVDSRGSRKYSLNALLRNGGSVALLERLSDPDHALYLEQLLETRLGIVDVAVVGEYV